MNESTNTSGVARSLPRRQGAVRLCGVTVVRGRRTVLAGVDCEITGPICCVIGENGAGKSTFLQALASLVPIRSGSIEAGTGSPPAKLGYLPQDPYFPGHFTAGEAISYAAWLQKIDRRTRTRAVAGIADRLGLAPHLGERLSALSGGTRQRVFLAQALVHGPELVILDEPTTGLDAERRVDFRRLLRELATDGTTIVLSTHLTEDVELLPDQVIALRGGRVVFDGSPFELAALGAGHRDDVRAVEVALRTLSGAD
jgi:ABC-2 type transport system ATP-binding protein